MLKYDNCANTPKYHCADEKDTPPSHFIMTLGQLVLLLPMVNVIQGSKAWYF